MNCPNCGNPLPGGACYCNHCGAPIQPPNVCPRCGAPAHPGDKHCSVCGYPLDGGMPPPYDYQNDAPYYAGPRPCSRFLAGILAILVGSLGIHNFYLGYTSRGVFQLLLTTVGAFFTCGISAIVAAIWALVEGVLLFTGNIWCDARGIPLRD